MATDCCTSLLLSILAPLICSCTSAASMRFRLYNPHLSKFHPHHHFLFVAQRLANLTHGSILTWSPGSSVFLPVHILVPMVQALYSTSVGSSECVDPVDMCRSQQYTFMEGFFQERYTLSTAHVQSCSLAYICPAPCPCMHSSL